VGRTDGPARRGHPSGAKPENFNHYRELLSIQELACVLITSSSPGCSSSEPRTADWCDAERAVVEVENVRVEAEDLQGRIRHDSTSGELNFDYVCLLFDYPSV
jgi:hypothetical protein